MFHLTHYDPKELGKFLRECRVDKTKLDKKRYGYMRKLTQDELAAQIPVKRKTVIDLERGQSKQPNVQLLVRWIELTSGNEDDVCIALGLAGHASYTILPSLEEIKIRLKEVVNKLEENPFPAYIIDHTTKIWAINAVSRAITIDVEPFELLKTPTDILDLLFNPRFKALRESIGDNIDELQREQVRRFKTINADRQFEQWYRSYPESTATRFGKDYPLFASMWNEITHKTMPLPIHATTFKWSLITPEGIRLYLEAAAQSTFAPNNLFDLITHQPIAEPKNVDNAEHYLKAYRKNEVKCWTVWGDLGDEIALERLNAYKPLQNVS